MHTTIAPELAATIPMQRSHPSMQRLRLYQGQIGFHQQPV